MSRRPLRFLLIALGLMATAGLGYRAWQDEGMAAAARQDQASRDRAAQESLQALGDLRASLHAYVASGQDLGSWTARGGTQLDTLRQRTMVLDGAMAVSGGSMAETLDTIDQIAAAEKRAREYLESDQALLAGDVIFTEGRDLLDAVGRQVTAARDTLDRDAATRADAARQEQAALAAGAVGLWVLLALLLVPSPRQPKASTGLNLSEPLAPAAPLAPLAPLAPVGTVPVAPVAPVAPLAPVGTVPVAPAAPMAPVGTVPVAPATLAAVAEICSDLSALSDVGALTGALSRAADVLGASGVIVWVASNDATQLTPVAAHGFDARVVSRIGSIPRDGANLTAAAFRDATAHVSPASETTPAALAVAMCGPSGPVGVLSAELRKGALADNTCVALATIFAAQLATLALPVPVPAANASDPVWSEKAQA